MFQTRMFVDSQWETPQGETPLLLTGIPSGLPKNMEPMLGDKVDLERLERDVREIMFPRMSASERSWWEAFFHDPLEG